MGRMHVYLISKEHCTTVSGMQGRYYVCQITELESLASIRPGFKLQIVTKFCCEALCKYGRCLVGQNVMHVYLWSMQNRMQYTWPSRHLDRNTIIDLFNVVNYYHSDGLISIKGTQLERAWAAKEWLMDKFWIKKFQKLLQNSAD